MSSDNKNWLSFIFNHGKWYLLSSLFAKGTGFFMLPIYTRFLTPSDYGSLNLITSIGSLMPIFYSLYLDSAFARFYHEYKEDKNKLSELFSSIFWFTCLFGLIVFTVSYFSSYYWFEEYGGLSVWPYAFLGLIIPLFQQVGNLGLIFLRQSFQSKTTSFLEFSTTIIGIVVSVVLLYQGYGILARLLGALSTAIFLFVFYSHYFLKRGILRFSINTKMLKKSLFFSLPLMPNIAAIWIAQLSDRLIISKYDSSENLGLYSLCVQIAMLIYVGMDAMGQVSTPMNMSGLVQDKQKTKKDMVKMVEFMWLAISALVVIVYLNTPLVLKLSVDSSYYRSYYFLLPLVLVYIFHAQYRIFSDIIMFLKKNWVISSGAIIRAIVSLGLNLILVPIWGAQASSWIALMSIFAYTVWIIYWVQKYEALDISILRLSLSIVPLFSILLLKGKIEVYSNTGYLIGIGFSFIIVIYTYFLTKRWKLI